MQEKVVFHLLIPSFLKLNNQSYQDILSDVELPQFTSLLTQFKHERKTGSKSLDQSFFDAISVNTEELPVAYYRHQVQLSSIKTNVMCADPVYLEVGLNDITLKHLIDDLNDEDAKELITLLNEYFSEDGLQFVFGSNQSWYVSFDDTEEIKSHEIDSVLMGNIQGKLAKSKKRNWQVIQNEAQMLLHSSEVNQHRERAGLSPINSLWFWGAGKPITPNVKVGAVYSGDDSKASLRGDLYAKAADCDRNILPNTSSQMSGYIEGASDKQFFILDGLFIPLLANNSESVEAIKTVLTQIDDIIIGPLLKAWRDNNIDIVVDFCNGTRLKPQKIPAWKFWLKPRKLKDLLNEISS